MRGHWHLLGTVAIALSLGFTGSICEAQVRIGSLLPNSGFTVDGRNGPYLHQIRPGDIDNRIVQEEAQGLSNEGDNIAAFESLQLRMPQVEAKLTEMLATVDGPWPHERPRQPQVIVLASGRYPPLTFPDGTIAVSMGLLMQAESDDEAAYILAHELSHLRLGHFADNGNFRRKRQIATTIGRAYSMTIAASEAELVRRGNHYQVGLDDNRRVREQRDAAANANATLRQLMLVLLESPWTRQEEDEADALAFDLIGGAGYAPGPAAPAVFSNLKADYDLQTELARHSREVFGHLNRTTMTTQNVTDVINGGGQNILSSLTGSATRLARDRLLDVGLNYLRQQHRTPEARRDGVANYALRAYPDGPPEPGLQTDWLDDIRGMAEFQQARTVVMALQDSSEKEAQSDLPGALLALRPALDTALFARAPVVANTAARLNGRAGDLREADRLYTIAHESPDQNLAAYVSHAELMADSRQFQRALEVIELGKARVALNEPGVDAEKLFLPALVMVSFRRRQQEDGLVYLRRCMDYEEEDLRARCTRAVFRNQPDDEEMDFETQARVNATLRNAEAQNTMGRDVDGLLRGVNSILRGGN